MKSLRHLLTRLSLGLIGSICWGLMTGCSQSNNNSSLDSMDPAVDGSSSPVEEVFIPAIEILPGNFSVTIYVKEGEKAPQQCQFKVGQGIGNLLSGANPGSLSPKFEFSWICDNSLSGKDSIYYADKSNISRKVEIYRPGRSSLAFDIEMIKGSEKRILSCQVSPLLQESPNSIELICQVNEAIGSASESGTLHNCHPDKTISVLSIESDSTRTYINDLVEVLEFDCVFPATYRGKRLHDWIKPSAEPAELEIELPYVLPVYFHFPPSYAFAEQIVSYPDAESLNSILTITLGGGVRVSSSDRIYPIIFDSSPNTLRIMLLD